MLIDNTTFFNLYNLIYFCTACLVVVSALSSEIKKDIVFQNKLGAYLVFFPLISLIILTGFRGYDVGADTENYYYGLWIEMPEVNFSGEFLFDVIALIMRYFNISYSYFLLFIAILFYCFTYKSIKNYTDLYKSNLLITFFSYMSFFFFLSMSINIIRQGVSLSILLFAYSCWINQKNKILILLLIFLSLAFHLTSIIPLLIFVGSVFIAKLKFLNILMLAYFLSIFISYFNYGFLNISPIFLGFLGEDERIGYFSDEDYGYNIGFKPQFVVFNTFFLLIALYVKRKLTNDTLFKQYSILFCYYIISSIILYMAFQLPFSDRWGVFSWFVIPFLISPLFYSPLVNRSIKIQYIVMLVLIYLGFKFYAS